MVGGFGGTRQSERAVAAALNWLARHQMRRRQLEPGRLPDLLQGRHLLRTGHRTRPTRRGTALGLLPFLAAGQTHESKGPYQKTIYSGIGWLIGESEAGRRPALRQQHVRPRPGHDRACARPTA